MVHNYTIEDIQELNETAGYYFFSPDTMRFFESKVESDLSDFGYFITSEKKCFQDYTRVYKVRQAAYEIKNGKIEFTGDVKSIAGPFDDMSDAEEKITELEKDL